MTETRPSTFFYGYLLVFAGFAVLLSTYGVLYSFGVFLVPMLKDLGLSRASVSGAYSLCFFLSGALAFPAGWLTDRIGPRIVISCSGILIGSGYLLLSRISGTTDLYLSYGLLVGIGMSGGIAPVLSTIARWFQTKRGLMIGFAIAGVGTGTLVMPAVTSKLIAAYGWRSSFFLLGITLLLAIVGLAQFFVSDPRRKGLLPYGTETLEKGLPNDEPEGIVLHDAYRDPRLWALFALYIFAGFVIQIALVHLTIYAISLGVSARSGALLLSFMGVGSLAGRIFGGGAADRFGSRPVMIIVSLSMAVLFSLLLVSRQPLVLALFAGFFGLVYGQMLCMMPVWPAELFGLRNHGAILGMITFASTIGGGLGPVVAGALFDFCGGYEVVWITCICVSMAAALSCISIRKT